MPRRALYCRDNRGTPGAPYNRLGIRDAYIVTLVVTISFCGCSVTALAYGHAGHEVVGVIADHLLTPNAAKKVQAIAEISLHEAAKWTDCAKDVIRTTNGAFKYASNPKYRAPCIGFEAGDGIARMEDYVKRNWDNCTTDSKSEPCHKQYHYADVAIQHDKYDRSYAGTSDHDIVSSINAAIAVLQGKPAPAPFSIKDKKEALLMLAHFVGDIHQPLHVGAVYIDSDDQPTDPDSPGHKLDSSTETRGGNSVDDKSTNLHTEWDTIPASIKPTKIGHKMLKASETQEVTPGDIASWPAAWATETLVASHEAFKGITFKREAGKPGHWTAEFKDRKAYLKTKNKIQVDQLTKAGARLAQVLNSIWP